MLVRTSFRPDRDGHQSGHARLPSNLKILSWQVVIKGFHIPLSFQIVQSPNLSVASLRGYGAFEFATPKKARLQRVFSHWFGWRGAQKAGYGAKSEP